MCEAEREGERAYVRTNDTLSTPTPIPTPIALWWARVRTPVWTPLLLAMATTLTITLTRTDGERRDARSVCRPLRHHCSPWLHNEFVHNYRWDASADHCLEPSVALANKCPKLNRSAAHTHSDGSARQSSQTSQSSHAAIDQPLSPLSNSSLVTNQSRPTDRQTDRLGSEPTDATDSTDSGAHSVPKWTDYLVSFNSCLSLDGKSAQRICDYSAGVGPRLGLLMQYHLKHCHRYPIVSVLSGHAWRDVLHRNSSVCVSVLSELIMLDNVVQQLVCDYESLLSRYDCHLKPGFSVTWTCSDCRKVYRDWVCSMIVPFHINEVRIKPCQSFCERVEQRCPHLHPYGKGQYAGEPAFLCVDANIPFKPTMTPLIPFGDSDKCYDSSHLIDSEGDDDNSVGVDMDSDDGSIT